MRLRVEHITHYQYDSPVRYALQQAKLTPKERPGQQLIHGWTIAIEGGAQQLHYTDHHGNGVDLIAVNGGTSELVIRCTGEVELVTWDGVIGAHRGAMPDRKSVVKGKGVSVGVDLGGGGTIKK